MHGTAVSPSPLLIAALSLFAGIAGSGTLPGRLALRVAALANPAVRFVPVASGLSSPVFVTHVGDGWGRVFIVERPGTVRVMAGGVLALGVWLDAGGRVSCCGKRGLLGLAFAPGFGVRCRFFVSYTQADGDVTLERVVLDGSGNPVDSSGTVLLDTPCSISSFSEDEAGNVFVVDQGGAVLRVQAT